MLSDVDQRHCKVARRVQYGQSQRACQHHVARGHRATFPQDDGPRQQADRQDDGDGGVQDAKPFQVVAGCSGGPPSRGRWSPRTGGARDPDRRRTSTNGMLLMTSTISPSTAAALSAKSWCSGRPAAARRNSATTITPATSHQDERHRRGSTVATNPIAVAVAAHGGSTFQTNMFSTVNTALDVAEMRLASVPGNRSTKYPGP